MEEKSRWRNQPGNRERENASDRARRRAVNELIEKHRVEFFWLLIEARKREGLDERA